MRKVKAENKIKNRDGANYRLRGDWYRGELIFEQKD